WYGGTLTRLAASSPALANSTVGITYDERGRGRSTAAVGAARGADAAPTRRGLRPSRRARRVEKQRDGIGVERFGTRVAPARRIGHRHPLGRRHADASRLAAQPADLPLGDHHP